MPIQRFITREIFLCLILAEKFLISIYFELTSFISRPNWPKSGRTYRKRRTFFLDQVTVWPYFMRNGAASREVRQGYRTVNTIEHALAMLKASGVFSRIAHHPCRDYGRPI